MSTNSAYADLRDLGVEFGPLSNALVGQGERSPFRAPWSTTLEELARELRLLEARHVRIELALGAGQFRRDGMPRADARAAAPVVVLEAAQTLLGAMRLEAVRFDDWQDNLRAIALGLHDARRMERYGVAPKGAIYAGFRQLAMGSDQPTVERGRRLAAELGGVKPALAALHPDGANPDRVGFESVVLYRDSLRLAGGS